MKMAASLMLITALSLSVYAQEFYDSADDVDTATSPDLEVEDSKENDPDDEDSDEIIDIDDAVQKYQMLKQISDIVDQGEAVEESLKKKKKRFTFKDIGYFFNDVGHEVKEGFKKVAKFATKATKKAKNAFKKITDKLDFEKTLAKVVPYIHSGMTVGACQAVVTTAAIHIFGPFAALAGPASKPLCDAGLAGVEKIAG